MQRQGNRTHGIDPANFTAVPVQPKELIEHAEDDLFCRQERLQYYPPSNVPNPNAEAERRELQRRRTFVDRYRREICGESAE